MATFVSGFGPALANATVFCSNGVCGFTCNAGYTNCGGVCRALSTDINHCGACGITCFVANGTAACSNGVCTVATCQSGRGNCNGSYADGCETNLNYDDSLSISISGANYVLADSSATFDVATGANAGLISGAGTSTIPA